jgi:hypothetical protein
VGDLRHSDAAHCRCIEVNVLGAFSRDDHKPDLLRLAILSADMRTGEQA